MRKNLILMIAVMCLCTGMSVSVWADSAVDWRAQERQLKLSQKSERDAQKLKERTVRQSFKSTQVTGAQRTVMIHQLQRQHRDLIQKQKDAMQKLKDQEKAYREYQRTNGG